MAGKELTTIPEGGLYLANYAGRIGDLGNVIADNMGGGGIAPRELPRIRIPSGGGKAWEVPTLEGDQSMNEVTVVIVHQKTMRAYFDTPFEDGSGLPPVCSSEDGMMGHGDPGGACRSCPFNEFNTAVQKGGTFGPGKACREVRALFVIGTGDVLPSFMPMPPMSIKPIHGYFARLTQRGVPFYAVETTFKLVQDKNKNGLTFSKADPVLSRMLNESEVERIREYRDYLKPAIDGVRLTREDVGAMEDA